MNLVIGLPRTAKGFDSIWVIVDRLTKIAHFLAVCMTDTAAQYARLYLDRIVQWSAHFYYIRQGHALYIQVLEIISRGIRDIVEI